jgi:hypothetical protein
MGGMNYPRLLESASFEPDSLQQPNAWVGHVPFAAWLMREVAPGIFVELGTHSGNSYFSFCSAVVDSHIGASCVAVDTWRGDVHAGEYGEDVFAKVSAHNQVRYGRFSRLMRMTFDEAAAQFQDHSIDLLHIDGLHTYDAVRHDFETWLPKLAPGAVVLLHDTGVREREFGVWKFWRELQARYPDHLEFAHSHGLGVLQLDNAPDEKRLAWLHDGSTDKAALKNYFAALGARQMERFEITELKRHIAHLDAVVAAMHASNSWRFTRPLRAFKQWLSNVF